MDLIEATGIRLLETEASVGGRGVFAARDFSPGEVIERGVMYRLRNVCGHENEHLFTWSDDRTVWAAGSGYLPFYNHSDTPNVRKEGDLDRDTMVVIALKPIRAGEELLGTYSSKSWRRCFSKF